ncbi:dihydroxyacetone kinase family protein [Bordetella tumulicola]|uniref:dihydroxyacetone kinase family protein n=1 Tax=Bordetella tumulicola TaxID=1649133 RepID=UPI0039EEB284
MKKLINDPRHIVREALEGLVDTTGHLALVQGENIVVLRDLPQPDQRPVAVLSGGGSGHEPAHAGYVGAGMLSAAIAGDVFTSPSVDAVLAAILSVAGPAGALLVVKNYTGDRLNFGLAAELAREKGIPVEAVVVADDVALRDIVPAERRRGIAGTVWVHKIAGAAAAKGWSLNKVAAVAARAAASIGSMGVGLGACTVPSAGTPSFSLGETEIEYGLGIHGEKGVRRVNMKPADAIVQDMLEQILAEIPGDTHQVALLVNGLGATPPLELQIVARHALATLRARGLTPTRAWVGNFMTALEMPGCSLSVLSLDGELLELLDAPCAAPAWTASARLTEERATVSAPAGLEVEFTLTPEGPLTATLQRIATGVAHALIAAEAELADLDAKAGDGDLGASMARGGQAILDLPPEAFHTPNQFFASLAQSMRRAIAGSSGPFYAVGLLRASRELADVAQPTPTQWQTAFAAALDAVMEMGGAKPGDRTMVDALAAASDAWHSALSAGTDGVEAFSQAVDAAGKAAEDTANMQPRLGRASYLGERAVGIPDGGAVAVTCWLQALRVGLKR